MTAPTRDAIQSVKRGHYPDAVAILLYGSQLDGSVADKSDVDLFVVTPPGDELHERRLIRDTLRIQCSAVPENALTHLPDLSRRAGRPIGLLGPAYGQLIDGKLPDFTGLQDAYRAALRDVNAQLSHATEHNLRAALDTAEAALARTGPGRTALALRAVPMLLEVALQRAADDHFGTRSQYRKLADAHPDIVDRYGTLAGAVSQGDFAPLRALVADLRPGAGSDAPNTVSRRLSLKRLIGEGPPR
ncbi:nucleotidyltransferase domain-containing protein [Tateyamaria omphalii]|nr:nucleotidyltransferase domain-containing protein [Tateyamaria omphalii]